MKVRHIKRYRPTRAEFNVVAHSRRMYKSTLRLQSAIRKSRKEMKGLRKLFETSLFRMGNWCERPIYNYRPEYIDASRLEDSIQRHIRVR